VTLFVGNYRHSIDEKGRLVLPSRFRTPFEGAGYIAPYEMNVVGIWTVENFERDYEKRFARLHESVEYDERFRNTNFHTYQIEIDKQGRFLLNPQLREMFGLDGEVVFAGNGSGAPCRCLTAVRRTAARRRWRPHPDRRVRAAGAAG
jgi:MraZ protein